MLIVSNFTDYYDYIGNWYGVDKKVVYKRTLSDSCLIDVDSIPIFLEIDNRNLNRCYYWHKRHKINHLYNIRSVIIAGYVYHIAILCDRNRIALPNASWEMLDDGHELSSVIDAEQGEYDRTAYRLCIAAKRPILNVISNDVRNMTTKVLKDDINLKEYGIRESAHTVWQRVYMFLSELYNIEKESFMTDIEKVESHGFDKRQSFRHRL